MLPLLTRATHVRRCQGRVQADRTVTEWSTCLYYDPLVEFFEVPRKSPEWSKSSSNPKGWRCAKGSYVRSCGGWDSTHHKGS